MTLDVIDPTITVPTPRRRRSWMRRALSSWQLYVFACGRRDVGDGRDRARRQQDGIRDAAVRAVTRHRSEILGGEVALAVLADLGDDGVLALGLGLQIPSARDSVPRALVLSRA